MSTPEQIVDETIDDTNLDDFNDLFLGKTKEAPTPEDDGPKEPDVVEDEADASDEKEETQETEDDADLAPDKDEEEAPKPKTRLEKRIEKLLENERLQRERADRAEAELRKSKETETPKPTPTKSDAKAPHFDDKNEDGTDKYPLGQFDPDFQEDRFNYMVEKSLAEQKAELQRQHEEAEARRQSEALAAAWDEKLNPARERYPDFTEKGEELLSTFANLDQAYGQYLTSTIMSMDKGPDVLYYLSNNIDEAEKIVKLGALGATLALGRIEAQFDDVEEKPQPRPRVSKAPVPPPTNRGSSAAVAEVPDDTDDLDAFSAKLFKKR